MWQDYQVPSPFAFSKLRWVIPIFSSQCSKDFIHALPSTFGLGLVRGLQSPFHSAVTQPPSYSKQEKKSQRLLCFLMA